MEITLTAENFEDQVLKSSLPVLVDFWAPWCGPCHIIAPSIAKIAEDYHQRLTVGKLNVDEHPHIAENYGIRSIPNLKIFKGGKVVDEIIGAVPASEIRKHIEKLP